MKTFFTVDDVEVELNGTYDDPWVDVNLYDPDEVTAPCISLTPEEAIMLANRLIDAAGVGITRYELLQAKEDE